MIKMMMTSSKGDDAVRSVNDRGNINDPLEIICTHSDKGINTNNTDDNSHDNDNDEDDDIFQLQRIDNNDYKKLNDDDDDDDKVALLDEEEFAKIASPKVSELLKEQAIVLDELLWSGYYGNDSSSSSNDNENGGDEDDIEEEWRRLETTQLNLKDELEAATKMYYYTKSQYHGSDKSVVDKDYDDDGDCDQSWSDSIHQYYIGSSKSNSSTSMLANDTRLSSTMPLSSPTFPSQTPPPPPPLNNHSYTLADHARAVHVSRRESDRGMYTMPLLSRNDIETMNIISLPEWISRPSTGGMSSRERELYMKRVLDCVVEYIEPIKASKLRKLFSGWVPGPGEGQTTRDTVDDQGVVLAAPYIGGDKHRIVAYHSSMTQKSHDVNYDQDNDGDSSCNEDENNGYGFEDINGVTHASPSHRQEHIMEPLPVRTVSIRIRCDVMCGAVMDALTTSVERLDGEITKRQGGHLRAILRGWTLKAQKPGELEKDITHEKNEDASDDGNSTTTGFSSILSPILRSPHSKQGVPSLDVLPPYILDAQIVTKKAGKECQRLILLRFYRIQDVTRVSSGLVEGESEKDFDAVAPLSLFVEDGDGESDRYDDNRTGEFIDNLLESKHSLRNLQEVASLIQRMKAVGGLGFAIDPPPMHMGDASSVTSNKSTKSYLKSFGDVLTSPIRYFSSGMHTSGLTPNTTVMELMSASLLQKFMPSPSVGTVSKPAFDAAREKSYGVFPSLSKEDEPYVQSSWMFLRGCIEELDRRCLAYSTLGMYRSTQGNFTSFQFSPLPTLDGHFLAQIKAFCRENMIVSLVKTASELEVYAREVEKSCANLDQLLRPTFDKYQLTPPQLPVPVPLTAYPLDFTAPEDFCPPWGPDVKAAIDELENTFDRSHGKLSGFECSEKAVSAVIAAFQKQNDVEQGARLGRKNVQVMDRLAKMQAHKRNSIARLRDSYGVSKFATEAGNEFHSLRQRSTNIGSLTDVINSVPDEIPLLTCNVLVGNAAGTCYVTHAHVLFNTQLLPVIGGSRIHLFSIMDIEVTINTQSRMLLSPLPASISFTTTVFGSGGSTREEVYNFIPTVGARRFANFIAVLRDLALENPSNCRT